MNNTYPYSIFYFTKSVFDEVGKNNKKAIELIFKAISMACFEKNGGVEKAINLLS